MSGRMPLLDRCNTRNAYRSIGVDQIRLLRLHPGTTDEELNGSLVITKLPPHQQSCALSYVWGVSSCVEHMLLVDNQGCICLGRSLTDALHSLRSRDIPIYLWVDAICINQRDFKERAQQVDRMWEIYSCAAETFVWLGLEISSDTLAVRTINMLYRHRSMDAQGVYKKLGKAYIGKVAKRQKKNHFAQSTRGSNRTTFEEGLQALMSIWARPWFARLWVLQEVAFSRKPTFLLGTHRLTFDKLHVASKLHMQVAKESLKSSSAEDWIRVVRDGSGWGVLDIAFDTLNMMHAHHQTSLFNYGEDLLDVVRHTTNLQTSQPLDRVYAILNLTCARSYAPLMPDYELSPDELWRRVALYVMQQDSTWKTDPEVVCACPALILALHATQERTDADTTPSWCPNFDKLGEHSFRKCNTYLTYSRTYVGTFEPSFDPGYDTANPRQLSVKGKVIAILAKTLPHSNQPALNDYLQPPNSLEQYWLFVTNELIPWYEKCHQFVSFAREQDLVGAEVKKLILQETVSRDDSKGPTLQRFKQEILRRSSKAYEEGVLDRMYDHLGALLSWDFWAVDTKDLRRVLARTDNGNHVWVPQTAEPGDELCLCSGAPFPFVLRRVEGPRKAYTVLGDGFYYQIDDERPRVSGEELVEFLLL